MAIIRFTVDIFDGTVCRGEKFNSVFSWRRHTLGPKDVRRQKPRTWYFRGNNSFDVIKIVSPETGRLKLFYNKRNNFLQPVSSG